MSPTVYWRLSLSLPLVLAVPSYFLGQIGLSDPDGPVNPLYVLASAPYLALIPGGIPYLATALAILVWSRRTPGKRLERAILLAPVLMIPWLWLYWLCLGLVSPDWLAQLPGHWRVLELAGEMKLWGYAGPLAWSTLMIGYSYVGLAWLGLLAFRRLGWLRGEVSIS